MAEYFIPKHPPYKIDDSGLVWRTDTNRVSSASKKVGGRIILRLDDRSTTAFAADLLAFARDGVPLPVKKPSGKSRPKADGEDYPIRTITLSEHWAELRAKAGFA